MNNPLVPFSLWIAHTIEEALRDWGHCILVVCVLALPLLNAAHVRIQDSEIPVAFSAGKHLY